MAGRTYSISSTFARTSRQIFFFGPRTPLCRAAPKQPLRVIRRQERLDRRPTMNNRSTPQTGTMPERHPPRSTHTACQQYAMRVIGAFVYFCLETLSGKHSPVEALPRRRATKTCPIGLSFNRRGFVPKTQVCSPSQSSRLHTSASVPPCSRARLLHILFLKLVLYSCASSRRGNSWTLWYV